MLMKEVTQPFSLPTSKATRIIKVTKLPATGEKKLLEVTAIVSAPRPIPTTRNDIWH